MHDERLRLRRAAATMHQSGRQWQGGILFNLVRARPALALAHARCAFKECACDATRSLQQDSYLVASTFGRLVGVGGVVLSKMRE